jgi:phosphoribosylanthranilate isomerase
VTTTRVKICGLTRSEDVIDAVAAGADALGFVFTPLSKRLVDDDKARELVDLVPAFVSRVGLFMDQHASEVRRVLENVPLNILQFHGSEDGAYCRQFGIPYIKALPMGEGGGIDGLEQFPDAAALLLDSHEPGEAGGTGRAFEWSAIPQLPRPLILAGGLRPGNVRRAIRRVRPWAVDVSSGVERKPGIKSATKMIEFINEAKRED